MNEELYLLDEIKKLILAVTDGHEARIRVLERKMSLRNAVISGVVSVVVALATALIASGCVAPAARGPVAPTPAQYVTTEAATVRVDLPDGGHGTGFWISRGLVMTAGHACPATGDDRVGDLDAVPVFVSRKPAPDLCVLAVQGAPEHPVLAFAASEPEPGAAVWYVGYPDATLNLLTGRFIGHEAGVIRASIPSYPGTSGSALMNEAGEVVGVIVAADLNFNESTWAMSLADVRAALLSTQEHK